MIGLDNSSFSDVSRITSTTPIKELEAEAAQKFITKKFCWHSGVFLDRDFAGGITATECLSQDVWTSFIPETPEPSWVFG